MKKQVVGFITSLLILGFFTTCSKESPVEPEKNQLQVQPYSFIFTRNTNSGILVISNGGSGELSWEISDKPVWLEASKNSGNITTEKDTVILIANIDQEFGQYSGTVDITSNRGNKEVTISLNISMWIQMNPMPTARMGHSSCLLDGKIYVIGGSSSPYSAYKKLEVYDPLMDAWTIKVEMMEGRSNFATCVQNEKIYAVGGGESFYGDPKLTIEEYDPANNIWTLKPNMDMPRARIGLTASLVNNKIYIIGGADADETPISEVDVYDLLTNTWTIPTNMLTPRSHLAAVVLNEKIYTIGGTYGPSAGYDGLTRVDVYDPATNTWERKADIIIGRRYISACALNGRIYVFGGTSGNGQDGFSSVIEYDPALDIWMSKTDMPTALAGLSAVTFNEKIYVSGGAPAYPPIVVKTMYEYEPGLETQH